MLRKTLLGLAAGVSSLLCVNSAQAQQMYLGRVILVGFNFCPFGTVEAAGQILPIAQNTALFSLLGTTYGGNGTSTFALPDLRGRTPNSQGTGPGLSPYAEGQNGGTETVTLTVITMPSHTHTGVMRAVGSAAPNTDNPTNAAPADFPAGFPVYQQGTTPDVQMAANTATLFPTGAGIPFENLGPYVTLRYCIVVQGVFPSRG